MTPRDPDDVPTHPGTDPPDPVHVSSKPPGKRSTSELWLEEVRIFRTTVDGFRETLRVYREESDVSDARLLAGIRHVADSILGLPKEITLIRNEQQRAGTAHELQSQSIRDLQGEIERMRSDIYGLTVRQEMTEMVINERLPAPITAGQPLDGMPPLPERKRDPKEPAE